MYTYQELLKPLENAREGRKLALFSVQGKIEKFILAEIAWNGIELYPQLDFYLEAKPLRDLAVRTHSKERSLGDLIDWVEAKMCYSDNLARSLTRYDPKLEHEYRNFLIKDAQKQDEGLKTLQAAGRSTMFTQLLFSVHDERPLQWRKYPHKWGRYSSQEIERAADRYVHETIQPVLQNDWNRRLEEDFIIELVAGCRLHVYVFRSTER